MLNPLCLELCFPADTLYLVIKFEFSNAEDVGSELDNIIYSSALEGIIQLRFLSKSGHFT